MRSVGLCHGCDFMVGLETSKSSSIPNQFIDGELRTRPRQKTLLMLL